MKNLLLVVASTIGLLMVSGVASAHHWCSSGVSYVRVPVFNGSGGMGMSTGGFALTPTTGFALNTGGFALTPTTGFALNTGGFALTPTTGFSLNTGGFALTPTTGGFGITTNGTQGFGVFDQLFQNMAQQLLQQFLGQIVQGGAGTGSNALNPTVTQFITNTGKRFDSIDTHLNSIDEQLKAIKAKTDLIKAAGHDHGQPDYTVERRRGRDHRA